MARKQYRRTCQDCGAVWHLPKELAKAKPPKGFEMASARITHTAGQFALTGKRGRQERLSRLEERQDTAVRARMCPECGSQSWTEEKVKV